MKLICIVHTSLDIKSGSARIASGKEEKYKILLVQI